MVIAASASFPHGAPGLEIISDANDIGTYQVSVSFSVANPDYPQSLFMDEIGFTVSITPCRLDSLSIDTTAPRTYSYVPGTPSGGLTT